MVLMLLSKNKHYDIMLKLIVVVANILLIYGRDYLDGGLKTGKLW